MTSTESAPDPSASPSWQTLGDRITKARKIAGFDIKDLHARTSINRNSLGQYEADKVKPRPYLITTIAMACRVSPHWLATGTGHPYDGTDRAEESTEDPSGGAATPSDLPVDGTGYIRTAATFQPSQVAA